MKQKLMGAQVDLIALCLEISVKQFEKDAETAKGLSSGRRLSETFLEQAREARALSERIRECECVIIETEGDG